MANLDPIMKLPSGAPVMRGVGFMSAAGVPVVTPAVIGQLVLRRRELGFSASQVGDDPVHIYCCDQRLALCGLRLDGFQAAADDDDWEARAECARVDALNRSCGARLCLLRNTWRLARRRWLR
jgi:hypothetical protein